jgi:hypothetical protein
MRLYSAVILGISFLTSCNDAFFPGPRKIDWKREWKKNEIKLKALALDIRVNGNKTYKSGNNDFPAGFEYPFDEGFYIENPFANEGKESIDTRRLTIRFYVDRGLLDHYSAFIYTNDATQIKDLDDNVQNGGNDFRIEPNWYMIND